ncbi:hypothetical protein AMTR_s00053p00117070 [Amborella trichopoda]|uniref:Uncharacterized protein n=1 Tax=Amborella trichopoda TaxID=13333 RepID=W1PBI7_AMBTC|nr:hypothetical protein AMTR_s00053p00117070 [Amborella trichopoda]
MDGPASRHKPKLNNGYEGENERRQARAQAWLHALRDEIHMNTKKEVEGRAGSTLRRDLAFR